MDGEFAVLVVVDGQGADVLEISVDSELIDCYTADVCEGVGVGDEVAVLFGTEEIDDV